MMWKVLSQGIHMWNMKALSLMVQKLWLRLKFLKSRSNLKVKVTRSKIMVWSERSCHKEYTIMWNMKVLSAVVHKLWPRLKILCTNDDNHNDTGAMTIVLRTFVTANWKGNEVIVQKRCKLQSTNLTLTFDLWSKAIHVWSIINVD